MVTVSAPTDGQVTDVKHTMEIVIHVVRPAQVQILTIASHSSQM